MRQAVRIEKYKTSLKCQYTTISHNIKNHRLLKEPSRYDNKLLESPKLWHSCGRRAFTLTPFCRLSAHLMALVYPDDIPRPAEWSLPPHHNKRLRNSPRNTTKSLHISVWPHISQHPHLVWFSRQLDGFCFFFNFLETQLHRFLKFSSELKDHSYDMRKGWQMNTTTPAQISNWWLQFIPANRVISSPQTEWLCVQSCQRCWW